MESYRALASRTVFVPLPFLSDTSSSKSGLQLQNQHHQLCGKSFRARIEKGAALRASRGSGVSHEHLTRFDLPSPLRAMRPP